MAAWLGGEPGLAAEDVEAALQCLALTIYHEARGEPEVGMRAVAHVVLNRTASRRFPRRVCDVVYQNIKSGRRDCEFSWACDGLSDKTSDRAAWRRSLQVARSVYAGHSQDPTGGALWYHADYVTPAWSAGLGDALQIGRHMFYQAGDGAGTTAAPARIVSIAPEPSGAGSQRRPQALGSSLPDATKAFLMSIRLSELIYAPDPKDRAVRLYGAMRREGDRLAAGLVLSAITPNAIVLRYEGREFRFSL